MSQIILYKTNSDRKQLVKRFESTIADIDTMLVKSPCSIINPTVQLSKAAVGDQWALVNYAYVPMFGRYYFVDDITVQNDGLLEMTLSIDVLHTYANQLKNLQLEIVRSSSLNSKMYIDPEMPIMAYKHLKPIQIGKIPESVSVSSKNYVLTVAGGT